MILLKALLITILLFAIPLGLLALFIAFPTIGFSIICIILFIAVFVNVVGSML